MRRVFRRPPVCDGASWKKLCGSIGLSLVLLYLTTWEYYCLVPDAGASAYAGVSLICVALGFIARKDIAALAGSFRVRQALLGYSFLLVWTLLILSMIRVYSGAGWSGDWAEHFQRTLFFLHRFPVNTPIIGGYHLPARPPLMNVLAAFFLAQTQDRFEIFQIVFSFINLLAFLPCCLIMPALGGRLRRRSILPLVALFALNPCDHAGCHLFMALGTYRDSLSFRAWRCTCPPGGKRNRSAWPRHFWLYPPVF